MTSTPLVLAPGADPTHPAAMTIWPPVVLAPMAGITNPAFRRLCREQGAGLYVCEMVTTRALVERDVKTMAMTHFEADETPRSLQLYGVDPEWISKAVSMVRDEDMADHIDLNFGCPVPKVTRKGGGSALPYKRALFRQIVAAAVREAGELPVTVKLRKGIDDEHLTYLDAGRIAQEEGVAWVALHGRTAADFYSGEADWEAIATLKQSLQIPVLGNGDIWSASDALRMVEQTGVDGVVIGRGCLGRPWLFGELAAAFDGRELTPPPSLGEVAKIFRRHAGLLVDLMGEQRGCQDVRKHVAWYFKGFPVGGEFRSALSQVRTLEEVDVLLAGLDASATLAQSDLEAPRGRRGNPKKVVLPSGWLDDQWDLTVPEGAELADGGG